MAHFIDAHYKTEFCEEKQLIRYIYAQTLQNTELLTHRKNQPMAPAQN